MMKKKSVTVNYLFNTAYQIFILIVPLVTTPYISRTLGASGIGVYSYTYSIVSYFLIFSILGTTLYGQRAIAYVQDDPYLRSCKFFEIFILRLLSTTICSLVYVCYLYTPLCKYPSVAWIQILWLAGNVFDVSWLLQGLEDYKTIVLRNTAAKLLNVVLIFGLVQSPTDTGTYAMILSGLSLAANLSVWPCLPRILRKVKIHEIRPFRNLREMILLFIPTVAVQINAVFDKTMIGWFVAGSAENGYYEQTEKVVRVALALVTSLSTVMIPRIAKLYRENRTDQMQYFMGNSYQFVWFAGVPVMLGLVSVMNVFVPVFYGPGYARMEVLMPAYALCVIPVALSNVTGCQFLIPTKRQNVYTAAVAASTVVNVLLNVLLIPRFLAAGAVAASVAAEYVGAAIMLVYVQRKKWMDLQTVFSGSIKKWMAGAGMFLCVRWTGTITGVSAGALILLIGEGMAVYFALLLVQKDAFTMWILGRFLERVRLLCRSAKGPDL